MKGIKIAARIILGLLLVIAAAGGIVYWWKQPAMRVVKGIARLVNETGEYDNPILEEAGWEKMADRITGGAVRAELDGSFLTRKQTEALRIRSTILMDQVDQKVSVTTDSRLFGLNLGPVKLSGDEERVYMEIPWLFDTVFWAGTKDFGSRYQESMWKRWLGWDIDEDYELKLVPEWESSRMEECARLWEERLQAGREILSRNKFLVALVLDVKKIKEEKDVYVLTLPKEAVEEALTNLPPQPLKPVEDLEIFVWMDGEDRIVKAKTAGEFLTEGGSLSIGAELVFEGKEFTLDQMGGSLTFRAGQSERTYSFGRTVTPLARGRRERWTLLSGEAGYVLDSSWHFDSKSFEIALNRQEPTGQDASGEGAAPREPWGISLKGSLEKIEGEKLILNVDSLTFPILKTIEVQMSGSLSIEPLSEEILLPVGEVDFFGMSEADVLALLLRWPGRNQKAGESR